MTVITRQFSKPILAQRTQLDLRNDQDFTAAQENAILTKIAVLKQRVGEIDPYVKANPDRGYDTSFLMSSSPLRQGLYGVWNNLELAENRLREPGLKPVDLAGFLTNIQMAKLKAPANLEKDLTQLEHDVLSMLADKLPVLKSLAQNRENYIFATQFKHYKDVEHKLRRWNDQALNKILDGQYN